jgi:hypothetical protein
VKKAAICSAVSIGRAFEWLRWRPRKRHAIESGSIEPDAAGPAIGTRTGAIRDRWVPVTSDGR